MELTPESAHRDRQRIMRQAGWMVTNQLVFIGGGIPTGVTTAKLRQVLSEIGVVPYYTFAVKGYMENNQHNVHAASLGSSRRRRRRRCFGVSSAEKYYDTAAAASPSRPEVLDRGRSTDAPRAGRISPFWLRIVA